MGATKKKSRNQSKQQKIGSRRIKRSNNKKKKNKRSNKKKKQLKRSNNKKKQKISSRKIRKTLEKVFTRLNNLSKKKASSTKPNKDLSLVNLVNLHKPSPGTKTFHKEHKSVHPTVDNKKEVMKHIIKGAYNPNKKYFIMLHVSWCPHCTDALPQFKEAEQQVKHDKNLKNINMQEYECEENPELKGQAEGFPTMFFVENNQKEQYNGGRSTQDIMNFIKSKMSSSRPQM